MKTQELVVQSVPLKGIRLIEASAGTGKTYTITSLYVRLVLGHECSPLSPEKILVVTFTRAATEELRDRIRKRLKQALHALEHDLSQDSLIESIASDLVDISQSKQRLKDAIQIMDMAAIYTIHGFAQRLLRQNAMESSVSDDFELSLDEAVVVQQAVRDVWRTHVYPLQGNALNLILQNWQTPNDLQKALMSILHKDVEFHVGPVATDYDQACATFEHAHKQLANKWRAVGGQFISSLHENPKSSGTFTRYLDARTKLINTVLKQDGGISVKDATAFSYFTIDGIKKSVKKGGFPSDAAIIDDFTHWWESYQLLEASRNYVSNDVLISLLKQTRVRLKQLKDTQGILAPDDLLVLLNDAMGAKTGPQLLDQIRHQYPVAMVDEFQDTDALQYKVFHAIYQADLSDIDLAMFMIGDPKQAIYKFRGADIFTYIQAKQAVDGAYSLDTNYRSTQPMVSAVNGFFSRHDRPFIYDKDIPFVSVKAKGDASALVVNNERSPALSWMFSDGIDKTSKQDIANECSEGCAQQICELLNLSQQGNATLNAPRSEYEPLITKPLLAKDVAVLVRSARQAKWIKQALSKRGIGSVYVGRESIFQSDQAMAMYSLLQAIHMLSEAQFRNAIAHPVWCVSLETLQQFINGESLWEVQLEQLYAARDLWEKKGVMAMFMNWLHVRDLPAAWLSSDSIEGERCLTNFLHLSELLQDASSQVQGFQGLISWLSHKISINLGQEDQQMLRLESDANLVQIVTIHKSKGLEYPVVFLPFSWDGKESSDPLFFDEDKNKLVCDLVGDFKDQRITEGLAEEVRLLYVALTRASAKCYVAIPKNVTDKKLLKTLKVSALYHVLSQGEVEGLTAQLQIEAGLPENIDIYQTMEMSNAQGTLVSTEKLQNLTVRQFTGRIKQDWSMSSFSSLIRHVHVPMSARLNLDEETDDSSEIEANIDMLSSDVKQELAGAFAFPRGAHAGNFLHTLLEEIDFTQLPDDIDELIIDLLTRFSIEIKWLDVVKEWLNDILNAPLMPIAHQAQETLSLSALTPSKKLVEMEFYFPVSKLNAQDFNQLLNQSPCLDVPVKPAEFRQLKGMLKGFVDLIFEWQGQYFILDYKSNYLGENVQAYDQVATHVAMSEHRYDVQLVIYTLALHRLLQLRITDYDYDLHIGGAYYLFLRGMNASDDKDYYGQYFHKPDKKLIESLDHLIKEELIHE